MRRTTDAIVLTIGGAALFLGGCLVGVAAQQYLTTPQTAAVAPDVAEPARMAAAEEPVYAQPIVQRTVKTIVVRADGTLVEPTN